MNENLQAVITANREAQKRARDLNVRAGANIFPVMSRSDWEMWLKERLNGAVSMATIPNIEKLRLTELEQEMVDLILSENPDTINLFETQYKVEYTDSYGRSRTNPLVRIDFKGEKATQWHNLPDDIRLPGGREVVLYSAIDGYSYYIEVKALEFKAKARECLNQGQWSNWTSDKRPTIAVPDLNDENATLPEILEAEYGKSVVDQAPLIAYGTPTWDSWNERFKSEWFQKRAEAEAKLEQAKAKFEEAKVAAREKRERETAKSIAELVQAKLRELYDKHYYNSELVSDLREQLSSRRYSYLPSSSAELKQWTLETEAIVAKVETALADIQRKKEEEEADLARAVASGEIFVGFEAWHRRGGKTNCGDGWVIKADGTLRERDSNDANRYKSDGNSRWERVFGSELALRWRCHHVGDVAGNSTFEVVKLPVDGLTPEQSATVRRIEEEIGAPVGAFGLDPEAKKVAEQRLQAISVAAEKVLGYLPSFSYYQVVGENGVMIGEETRNLRVNWSAAFNQHCDGRDAQVVRAVSAADGMLEFLAYEKYGQTNIAMRWRELTEEEKAAKSNALPVKQISVDPSVVTAQWQAEGKNWYRCASGLHTEKSKNGPPTEPCRFCR